VDSGVRAGELCNIDITDVSLSRLYANVVGKRGDREKIYFNVETCNALKEWLTHRPDVESSTFAVLRTQNGQPTRSLQVLGRWRNLNMVERYTAVMARDDSIVRQSAEQYSPPKDCDRLVLPVAMAYADPVESAFDLYRRQLHTAVGWPPLRAGGEKSATDQRLTEFLWRGTLPDSIPKAPPGS